MAIERYIYIEKGWCVSVGGTTFRPAQMNGKVTTFQLIGLESFPPKKERKVDTHNDGWQRKRDGTDRGWLCWALARRKLKLNFAICQLIIYLKSNWKLILQHEPDSESGSGSGSVQKGPAKFPPFDFRLWFSILWKGRKARKRGLSGRGQVGPVNAFPSLSLLLSLSLSGTQKGSYKIFCSIQNGAAARKFN